MGNLVLNSQTVLTQTGTNTPEIANPVLNKSFTELDTSASNGATSNADNTALPLFGCRAFVNFDGTSVQTIGTEEHCAIRSSGNVSKVVKKGTGDFEVHFVTAMPDENYAVAHTVGDNSAQPQGRMVYDITLTDNSYRFKGATNTSNALHDTSICTVIIFR